MTRGEFEALVERALWKSSKAKSLSSSTRVRPFGALLGALLVLGAAEESSWAGKTAPISTQQVSAEFRQGQDLYATHCAKCHGIDTRGTDKGPTFLTKIYAPYLHADIAFLLAVERGVRAHHWRFGDMPKIQGVSREDIRTIVEYIRWLQREAGID
jgi:mono/diheme cytochrome c family protein